MQHTSRKGPRAACSQPSWFERDDLHLRDERVERPSFVGVGQKSSCIVSYTAAAAPRRRAFFMGRVLKDFAARKNRPHWVGLTATLGHEVFAYGAKTMTSPPPYGPGSAYVVFSQRQGPTLCIIVSPHCLVSMPRPSRQHRVAAFGLMETDVKDRHRHAPGADTADIPGSHTML